MRSIKTRVIGVLLVVFLISLALTIMVQKEVIFPGFTELENDEAGKKLQLLESAIKREIQYLNNLAWDWAAWDDTYDFVVDNNQEYVAANLVDATLLNNEINLIYFVNNQGKVVWGKIIDLQTEAEISLSEFPGTHFSPSHPLLSINTEGDWKENGIAGLYRTDSAPMLIASRPILSSDSQGPARGRLIIGAFLSPEYVATLAQQTQTNLQIEMLNGNADTSYPATSVLKKDSSELLVVKTFYDIESKPLLNIQVKMPRLIYERGASVFRSSLILNVLTMASVFLLIYLVVVKKLLGDIVNLTANVVSIGSSDKSIEPCFIVREDEIGTLASEFNYLIRRLKEKNRELASRNQAQQEVEKSLREARFQLERARKMEAVGLLAGGVAHDLNNILSGVVGYPDLLLSDQEAPERFRRPLQAIKMSGEKAAAVVEDLLCFSRSSSKDFESLNVNDVINAYLESADLKLLKMTEKSLEISSMLDDGLENIMGSASVLKSVVANLVKNAGAAIPQQGKIEIKTDNVCLDVDYEGFERIPAGSYVLLSVSDNGLGIRESEVEHIFEPFFTRSVIGRDGTGLGLAIVWSAVHDHQGFIDVKTAKQGNSFSLYFPQQNEYPGSIVGQEKNLEAQ